MPLLAELIIKLLVFLGFILSGGIAFARMMKDHKAAWAVLGVIGILSTLFLAKDIWETAQPFISPKAAPPPIPQRLTANDFYFRGNDRLDLGDKAGALNDFESALLLEPRMAQALFGRARALTLLGRFDDAMRSLDEAQRLIPTCPRPTGSGRSSSTTRRMPI